MTRSLLIWIVLWVWSSAALATDVELHVLPGQAAVLDADAGRVPLATADGLPVGICHLPLSTSNVHHLIICRPPYDELSIAVRWDPWQNHWTVTSTAPQGWLGPANTLMLSRTLRIATTPVEHVVAYMEAEPFETSMALPLRVDGLLRLVVPVPRRGDAYVLPHAWRPPAMYLVRPLFDTATLQVQDGALDSEDAMLSAVLHPTYGPFSDPWLAAGLVLMLAAAAWLRRSQRRLPALVPMSPTPAVEEPRAPARKVRSLSGHEYVLLRLLGHGTSGTVYEAWSDQDEPVAVKVLKLDRVQERAYHARFLREIEASCAMDHPAIVRVLDYGFRRSSSYSMAVPFLVMERVEGQTLRSLIEAYPQGIPDVQRVCDWITEVLEGLEVAHAAGVIHRDIKPENLMLSDDGQIKIMDFGLARHGGQSELTPTHAIVGTPLYMSPEHLNARHVTPQSDLFSLGVVAFELLCGQPPHAHADLFNMLGRLATEPVPSVASVNPDVPVALADLLQRMTALSPDDRYESATAVLHDLRHLDLGLPA